MKKFDLFRLNNIFLIILIFQFVFKNIISQDSNNDCSIISLVYGEQQCSPQACSHREGKKFFGYSEGSNDCIFSNECNNEIVLSTGECSVSCRGKKLGEFCYSNSELTNEELYIIGENVVSCRHVTQLKLREDYNKLETKCFYFPNDMDENHIIVPCDLPFYRNNKCVDECGSGEKIKKRKIHFDYKECVSECNEGTEIFVNIKNYCADSCITDGKLYYYYDNVENDIKCLDKCNEGYYDYDDNDKGYKCILECKYPRLYNMDETETIHKCYNKKHNTNGCDTEFEYIYNNMCFKSCDNANNYLRTITTYIYEAQKRCVEHCYIYNMYIDINGEKCVYDCKSNKYYVHNYRCYAKCPPELFYVEDELEEKFCLSNCPYGYYKLINGEERKCVKKCDGLFIDPINKACTSCEGDFKLEGKETNDGTNICYTNCPSYTYYKYGFKICKYYPPDSDCYFIEENYSICYGSCVGLNSYKYEDNNICYKEFSCGDKYYYKDENGIYKCIPEKGKDTQRPYYIKLCTDIKYYYLRGKECVKNCLENEYIIFPTNNSIYLGITILGACCSNYDCNSTYIYHTEDHILLENCPYKKIDGNNERYNHSRNGNCVKKCPPEYPYESGEYCKSSCESDEFIYTIGNSKKCVSKCKDYNQFYFNDEKDCLDSCKKKVNSNSIKYYYYEEKDNRCYTSCILNEEDNKFSIENNGGNYHQKCLNKCPDQYPYYYKEDNFCLSNCGDKGFIKFNTYECVHQCEENEVLVYNKYCKSNDSLCPKEEPFIVIITINGIKINKCVANCLTEHYKYFYLNKCYHECPEEAPFHYNNSNQCINECNSGHYLSLKTCYTKCPDSMPYFIEENNKNFKCLPFCDLNEFYVSTTNECVKECKIGENFIGKNKRCKNKCDKDIDGEYYIKYKESSDSNYIIYLCIQDYKNYRDDNIPINNNNILYLVEDSKEIVIDKCPLNKPYASSNGFICLSNCKSDPYLQFSTIKGDKKICSSECLDSEYKYYYPDDKICLKDCKTYRNDIINDENNTCVSECDKNSKYKFKVFKEEDNSYHCSTECLEGEKYFEDDYKCLSNCPEPYNYVYNSICNDKCPKGKFAVKKGGEYICEEKCPDNKYYYEKDRECIDECYPGDYSVQITNECVSNCSLVNSSFKYHIYDSKCVTKCPSEYPYLRENNQCYKNCNPLTYKYHIEREYNCLLKCPKNMIIDNDICVIRCPNNKFLDRESNKCITNCSDSSLSEYYYVPLENICLKKCNNTLYTDGFKCVNSCMIKPNVYLDKPTKKCVSKCPENRNFFIEKFNLGEENVQRECLENCTENYPYYIQNKDNNTCISFCPFFYYLPDIEQKIPIKCYEDGCPDEYNYYVRYSNGSRQCFPKCPDDYPYYNSLNQCFKECPPDEPYYKFNTFKCIKEKTDCETKIIDYNTKKCVFSCPNGKKLGEKGGIIYCLDRCNLEFGEFLFNGKCSHTCNDNDLIQDLSDPENKKCVCNYLYYMEGANMNCIDSNKYKECEKYHPYRIFNSNECTNYCFGFLSPNRDICYQNAKTCDNIGINYTTPIISDNNIRVCDCKYRHYINLAKKKVCIEDKCSLLSYQYYIPKLRECVPSCNEKHNGKYKYFFDGNCYEDCKDINMTNSNSDECICEDNMNWYKIGETGYISYQCIKGCNREYPYSIDETKQCVKNCTGLKYNIFYENKCYSSCPLVEETYLIKVKPEDEKIKEIAPYTCRCGNLWYYDNGKVICTKFGTIQNCKHYNFKFLVRETNQCTNSCPDKHPYFYNKECFSSCSVANINYQYPVKNDEKGSKRCACQYLWKKIDGDEDNIECLKNVVCEDSMLMINETKECVYICPKNYPLEFNGICYKKGNCPDFSEDDAVTGRKCVCKNLWHKQSNGHIFCIKEDKCPITHIFKNSYNKECVSDPGEDYILNYTLYQKCPDGTIESNFTNEAGKTYNICVCDQTFGYWYRNKKEFPEIICQLNKEDCKKENIFYHNNRTKECIDNCEKNKLYRYEDICYEDQCPNPTVSKDELNYKYTCIVKKYSTSSNITELYDYLKEEIVSLYKNIDEDRGVLVYKNFSSTMQIYGIKKGEEPKKNLISRADISYINISSCVEKIFENNKKGDIGDIIVVKFDLENQPYKSLINPVEYEFVSSETGQVLDASVCHKNNIIISYSLSSILNHYSKTQERKLQVIEDDINLDKILFEVQRQYKDGKRIASEFNLDVFDINSTLYKDNCLPFEINGNDLIIEDRIKYLFPYYSLCEENCTYHSIDYEYERIYCNCTLKTKFDLEREHKFIKNPYNDEEVISRQKGPTNFYVMQCFSKLKYKNSLIENPGFFYSSAVILFEIILFFITIFYNYKILKKKINKNSLNQMELGKEKEKEKEINLSNIPFVPIGHKKKIKNIAINEINKVNVEISEKPLNSPPPKKKEIKIDAVNLNDDKMGNNTILEKEEYDIETEDPRLENRENIKDSFTKDNFIGFIHIIQKEHELLRIKYELVVDKDKSSIITVLLTEICDKIYIIKTLCLLGKYDMFTIHFSLYILCHILLLTFITFFYDINIIKKIWHNKNFPNLSFHLLYGLINYLMIWFIYKIFLCLLNNEDIIQKYTKNRFNTNNESESENVRINKRKFSHLLCKIKCGMIAYFIIQFILVLSCSIYLTMFCVVYIGTKRRIFKTYGIALAEMIIIKIIYGLILGTLRKIGLSKKIKLIYRIAYYLDKVFY